MLCGYFFLALVFWAGERSVGLRPHAPQGEPLWLSYPSRILAAACGNGPSFFHLSALPTSLNGASVDPWL